MSVFLCVIVVFNYFCWMIQGAKHEDSYISRLTIEATITDILYQHVYHRNSRLFPGIRAG